MFQAAYKIEVRQSDSEKIIQVIKNFQMLLCFSKGDFHIDDINFDGFKDIRLEYNRGATGNGDAHTWLFDPNTGKFIYSEEFSGFNITAEIDSTQRTISEYWHMSASDGDTWIYKVEKNKPILFKEISTRDGIETTKEYRGKRLISVKTDTIKSEK